MTLSNRLYWALGLLAVFALAAAAVTLSSPFTSASGPDPAPAAQSCDAQGEADDAAEAANPGPDTDNVENECVQQETAGDGADTSEAGLDTVVPCSDPTGVDDGAEAKTGPDTDNIQEQCGPQDAED